MTSRVTSAELALLELGITEPHEIDVEVIARSLGAKVKYRRLASCEARIVGRGDRAIITVDDRPAPRRRRFSVAHELGHWQHHRGRCLICRSTDIGVTQSDGSPGRRRPTINPETVADAYAADLLLPNYIFRPMIERYDRLSLHVVRELSQLFDVSLTATALRALGTNRFPTMLVCHSPHRRVWFRRPPIVPDRWFPRSDLLPESSAFDLLYRAAAERAEPRRVKASAWFDRHEADRFQLVEQSFHLPDNKVATLLTIEDPRMLEN